MSIRRLYRDSLALLTDLYELTMAYGYWKLGMAEKGAVFNHFFRRHPFDSGFTVAAGLAYLVEFLQTLHFDDEDLAYLGTLTGNDGRPLFESAFFDYLRTMTFACDIDAVPEGTVVFPHEPLVRVTGPILQCQLLETSLLNMLNFQTLIATKAARVCLAARGTPVIEFGLRRAQGIDGGVTAARAAFIGGCTGTSNVLAGKLFDIPVRGTIAHSWVMAFDSELASFAAYARVLPNNCVFLVDTYNSLDGVRHAVEVGKQLRERGHEMIGIRLDSGDLAYLSIEARKMLDAGGFPHAIIFASSDLDEYIINSLLEEQDARIDAWGVGTRLVTAHEQPALGGVYKLAAMRDPDGQWVDTIKLSEQASKINVPGLLQVRRYRDGDLFAADSIYDERLGAAEPGVIVDPGDMTRRKHIAADLMHEDLLVPIFRQGKFVYDQPDIHAIQQRTQDQLAHLHPGIMRLTNPHAYPAGLDEQLHIIRTALILEARERIGA